MRWQYTAVNYLDTHRESKWCPLLTIRTYALSDGQAAAPKITAELTAIGPFDP